MIQKYQDSNQKFLLSLLDNPYLMETMQRLCNFLSEQIPCNRVVLYEIDNEVLETRIIYDNNFETSLLKPKVKIINQKWPMKEIMTTIDEKYNKIDYLNDTRMSAFYKQFSVTYPEGKSVILFQLPNITKQESLQMLLLFSNRINAFTDEHIRIMRSLREPILLLCSRLLENYHEKTMSLFSAGELNKRADELLQMCPGLRILNREIKAIAPSNSTVLIYGETGVGKELVADSVCTLSSRAENQFIKINCGALSPSLIDSELFGVVRGAFTGAIESKKGVFEAAHGGTLYLDEISELSLDAQVRLLRVLEAKEIRRVGDTKRIPINVRIITATNKNLTKMVEQGTFRTDLLHRLQVIPLYVPSLTQRPQDIPILSRYFYDTLCSQLNIESPPAFTKNTIKQLLSRKWPGNIRQLKHTIERSLLLNKKEKELKIIDPFDPEFTLLGSEDLITKSDPIPKSAEPLNNKKSTKYDDPEYFEIISALRRSNNKIEGPNGAATLTGLKASTFRDKMKKLGITRQ